MEKRQAHDSVAVRRRNLGLVLRHIAEHGPCARTEIASATGLSHASVTTMVTDLATRGLIAEGGILNDGSRGRPRRLLRLIPHRATTIAVQITSEHLRVAVADLAGTILWQATTPHHAAAPPTPAHVAAAESLAAPHDVAAGSPGAMADAIAVLVRRAQAAAPVGAQLVRLAVAMAGPVGDDEAQTVLVATDFGWLRPVRLRALLAARLPELGCPIDVINDANAAALAEYHAHPRRPRGVVYIAAGTGIGGGVVLDGTIHTGSRGIAGEPGHMPVAFDGPPCVCGARGCLVCYAGPDAVLTAAGLGQTLRREGVTSAADRLTEALARRDERALAAVDTAGRALGTAILSSTSLLDLDEVILGGLLAQWFPWLEPVIRHQFAGRRALVPTAEPDVTRALLGADAALSGVIEFARRAALSDPATVARRPR
ncbi:putative NBD/HSP70 family sugar kinase [Nocardia tenerifensis]|uniref:Putative NBD/HSP70 family sugar kinase n=1 Tax=Nocardia tenerifensis TaxID=228006 RepID=A0A318KNP1_9NOCA|nr:ROK family transcriptional regulator [Nocardia tenerifensis]PXX71300.1 putative NBD/HSP70 family sugar kinase [Nocardia tenerifensis]